MKRLPKVLVITGATVLVLVALVITGLRLVLPRIDEYRPQLVAKVESYIGVPIRVTQINAAWNSSGPQLELKNLSLTFPESTWKAERITLALDVWRSLLHLRWQFRDLTFYRLQMDFEKPLFNDTSSGDSFESSKMKNVLLKQLSHFDLRDSSLAFPSPSGERVEFDIPQLTWLNTRNRHRAEGLVRLSGQNGELGLFQVRMDLRDGKELMDRGTLYLQADDVDMKPWFSRLLRDTTGLGSAQFSLASWLKVESGDLSTIDVQVKQGKVNWHDSGVQHRLDARDLLLQVKKDRENHAWQLDIPSMNFITDGKVWPKGAASLLWLPEEKERQEQLRVRAKGLSLERLSPLLPALSFLTPDLINGVRQLQPKGQIDFLAVDIPLKQPEESMFEANWQNLSWNHWKQLPGMENFSGLASGSLAIGALDLNIGQASIPYGDMFRAPLELKSAQGKLEWRYSESKGFTFWSDKLDIKAKSLWANGGFNFELPTDGEPFLSILAGIRLYDASDAWRYYPEPLMGTHLTDYLSKALQGGKVDNATLVYAGNPHLFPFRNHDGLFQVLVPVKEAIFQFQPGWPALNPLAIDLNFLNDSLWMNAPIAKLGDATGKNISANIPAYHDHNLLIDADIQGHGKEIHDYFLQSPLKTSVGAALNALLIDGDVSGRLHLNIPLDGEKVDASGSVSLRGNSLKVVPINSTFDKVSGDFRFDNGDLKSNTLSAQWFGQPVLLDFSTRDSKKEYQINVNVQGKWDMRKLPDIPESLAQKIEGIAKWDSKVAIRLPHQGKMNYQIGVTGDLSGVSSHLPSPLNSEKGQPAPLNISVTGGIDSFMLKGSLKNSEQFNSQWLIGGKPAVILDRLSWVSDSQKTPALPDDRRLQLKLSDLDGDSLLALAGAGMGNKSSDKLSFPKLLTLQTPSLDIGGQKWRYLTVKSDTMSEGMTIAMKGVEIDGQIRQQPNQPLKIDLKYLYYNPQSTKADTKKNGRIDTLETPPEPAGGKGFGDWPNIQLRCEDCWLMGQRLRTVNADLQASKESLRLTSGTVNTGNTKLDVSGEWRQSSRSDSSHFHGKLSGTNIDTSTGYFGMTIPLKKSPFDVDFNLNWQGIPWKPQLGSLEGELKAQLGKGEIADMGGGRAGQLLRLVSFDALLRKLRFDFSDTFGEDFYFDSIRSHARVDKGIVHTDNLKIDGLAADISMTGNVDLVKRRLEMEAVIAPELSATVGVAAAFVINPVVGAAVFAASKALGPLWDKFSLIRYQISGSLDEPKVDEVLRQPKEAK